MTLQDEVTHLDFWRRILGEDKVMVEKLRPDLLQREVNVKADGVQTAFRKVCAHVQCVTGHAFPT